MMVMEREVYQFNNISIDFNFTYFKNFMKCILIIN
jgi:hypothetical protein